MAKKIRRMLAMVLVMCMFVSALPMQALAAEDGTVISTEDGITTTVTTNTTTSTDSVTGDVTVTIEIQQTTDGTSESTGAVVEGSASSTVTTTTDSEGNLLEASSSFESETTTTTTSDDGTVTEQTVTEGSESETKTGLDVQPGDEVPTVEVTVTPGESNSESVSETTTKTEGDVPENSDDPEYDYTETTTTVDRTVEVSVEQEEITVESDISVESVGPDDYEGKKDLDDDWVDGDEFHIQEKEGLDHEGYDYQYIGYSEFGNGTVSAVKVVYKKDENGEILKDADGNPVIDHFLTGYGRTVKTSDGEVVTDIETLKTLSISPALSVVQFLLQGGSKEDFQSLYAYCCNVEVDPLKNTWYTVENLEDSDYYPSEESEAHIRGIVSNGYWGASNEPDADGNYKTGSIALIKENMKQAIQNGEIEDVLIETKQSESGEEVKIYLSDVIDELTEGEAMQATQAAIWSYSNGSTSVLGPTDGYIILDPAHSETGADAARITALYDWLIQQTAEKKSTVINEQNFIEEVTLAVGKKVDEVTILNEDNTTSTNGVYETDLNFTLAFVPTANDDLLVCLKYIDLDGNEQTVTKRLAGNAEDYERLGMNEDGSYTFTGLKLRENQDFDFNLNLKGTQYLEKGVYIYTAQGGVNASQTFVGVAEGTQDVNVSASMSLSFSVDEEKVVHVEHQWREESDPVITPPPKEEAPPKEYPVVVIDDEPPQVFRLNAQENNLVEIPEEPVPLAAPVVTGDHSGLWIAVVIMAMFGMVAVNLIHKKGRYEAI